MALNTKQVADLNALNQKISTGYTPTSADTANLNFAKKQGYNYTPMAQDAIKVANPNELAGLNESQIYRSGKDIYKLPSVISSDMITGGTAPTIKTVDTSADQLASDNYFNSIMGAAGTDIAKFIDSQAAERKSERETKLSPLVNRANELITETTSGKADRLTAVESSLGADEMAKQLMAKNSEISALNAGLKSGEAANRLRVASASSIYGREALLREKAQSEIGWATSEAIALQGNIEYAQKLAERTVNKEFEARESELKLKQEQIKQVYDELSASDKLRADKLSAVLNIQQDNLTTQKEEKKNSADAFLTASKNNAPADVRKAMLDIINRGGSYTEVINAGAGYLGEEKSGTWQESSVNDKDGNPMLFNNVTGEYKTSTGTTINNSTNSYTDGAGNTWSLAGWATDPTKASQMQSIANKIGKVDDSNIEEKVKQFTPGVTADMIKEASAQSGVSWEAIMTQLTQESLGGTSNVAKNNNNFGGLTWSANTQWQQPPYNGTIGTARPEGGNYIKFPTKQAGLNALAALQAQYGKVDTTPTTPVNSIAVNWAENIRDGKAKLSDITSEVEKSNPGLKSEVNSILKSLPPSERQINEAKDFIKKLKELKDNSGLKYAVGPNWATRGMVGIGGAFGAKDDFLGKAQTLISKKALGALIEAKSQGATFGALSDAELELLKSSGTTLSAWANEKNEKITGFDISEKKFKEELDNMITEYEKIIAQANGGQSISVMSEDDAYKLYQQIVNK